MPFGTSSIVIAFSHCSPNISALLGYWGDNSVSSELIGILVTFRFHNLSGVAFYVVHVDLSLFELTIQTLYEHPIQIDFRCSLLFIGDSKIAPRSFKTLFFLSFLSVSWVLQV